MKFQILLPFIFSLITLHTSAQYESVNYDFEKNWFGENQKLPAETPWMLNGDRPPGIGLIEVQVYSSSNIQNRTPEHRATWSQGLDKESTSFSLPVNYNLRGNSNYTIAINYYRSTDRSELDTLRSMVYEAAAAYLDLNVVSQKNSVDLRKHPKLMKQDLDKLVGDGLGLYRNELNIAFPGFSQLVSDQLENLEDLRLRDGRFNVLKKEGEAENSERVLYFNEQLNNLKQIVKREIDQYLSYNFYTLDISRIVTDYETEKTRTVLPINIGYGVLYDEGDFDNLSYATAPFVGISIPLANSKFSGKFWSNSSLSAGVFVNNFQLDDDVEYTGPFIERPFYLAYGYKTAHFIRFNAGVTVLENADGGGDVFVRPFIGASIELNLWLGLSR